MSSILEALREIEDERRRARGDRKVSVADAPGVLPGSSGLVYPLIGGLAVGALVFGLWISGIGRGEPGAAPALPAPNPSAVQPPASPAATPSPAAASPAAPAAVASPPAAVPPFEPTATDTAPTRPAWLEAAEAPQARVTSDAPPPAAAAPAPPAAPASRPGQSAGSVMVESIRYAAAPEQRTVTLRLDGRRVTLRQGEGSGGIVVQLIMDDGAYLNRGAEVFFAAPTR
jgi:hypothetical protein